MRPTDTLLSLVQLLPHSLCLSICRGWWYRSPWASWLGVNWVCCRGNPRPLSRCSALRGLPLWRRSTGWLPSGIGATSTTRGLRSCTLSCWPSGLSELTTLLLWSLAPAASSGAGLTGSWAGLTGSWAGSWISFVSLLLFGLFQLLISLQVEHYTISTLSGILITVLCTWCRLPRFLNEYMLSPSVPMATHW